MGIFNKTEEEKRQEEERRMLVTLRDRISYSNELDQFTTIVLTDYLNGVIFGTGKNDFYDVEFLVRVFEQLNVNEYKDGTDVKQHLEKILSCMHDLLPFGKKTANYEEIREFIIDYLVAPDGFINTGLYDYSIFNKFKDISEYSRIMKSISKNEKAVENFQYVKSYISNASKWYVSRDEYVSSILASVDELDSSVLDVPEYFDKQIEDAKKKAGVYSISHDDIVEAASLFNRMNSKIEEMSSTIDLLNTKKKEVVREATNASDQGVQKIIDETERSIKRIREERQAVLDKLEEYLEKEHKRLISRLDDYLEVLKENMNAKADAVFSEILDKYQEQLSEFRAKSENFASANARSLALLKSETEKSISAIKELASDSPQYEDVAKQVEQSAELTNKILELISQNKELMESADYKDFKAATGGSSKTTKVKGIEQEVYSDCAPNIVIPKSIEIGDNIQLLDCYNYNRNSEKELDAKIRRIEKEIKEREANGEIFHSKIKEIIRCLLVGDWPYMFGPSGAGKGFIVKQIGELLKQDVIDGGKIGEVHTILGYIDAQGRFRATPGFVACINGSIIFYDEFDNGNSDSRVAINTIYSNLRDKIDNPQSKQYIRFAGEIDVPINPNMRMIAAGNTDGSGRDPDWPDRYPTDESIKERYKVIYVPYDNRVEEKILKNYPEWYKFFVNFRKVCEDYSESQDKITTLGNASTRDAADIRRDVTLNSKSLSEMIDEYFVQIKEQEYRDAIARDIASIYSIGSDQSDTPDFTKKLSNAKGVDIAKQFVKGCNLGIERKIS